MCRALHVSFEFKPVSCVIVREAIENLKSKNSNDVYNINVKIIKSIKNIIISPLTKLINLCIAGSTFPDCLKKAVVVPIYKRGDPNNPSNYRPIALLPIFGKVLEKILFNQLNSFFETNNLFSRSQYGFRKQSSTIDAVQELVDFMSTCLEEKQVGVSAFLDLSKAFDCVSHNILLKKLAIYNLKPSSINMVSSYLNNRSQVVKQNEKLSRSLIIHKGVPQGSILGPLLFLIFINDLPSSLSTRAVLYADDTTLLNKATSVIEAIAMGEDAQSEAFEWFKSNRLQINQDKSEHMIFTLKRFENPIHFAHSVKFLGIHVDNKLQWHAHGEETAKKVCKSIFLLRNLKGQVSDRMMRMAYFALCQSHLTYGILVWGHSCILERLFKLQRRAIRILAGAKFREHCKKHFIELNILTLPSIYILNCLIYVKSHTADYKRHNEIHSHDTRNNSALCLNKFRLKKNQNSVNYFCVKLFNKLPMSI